MGSPLQTKFDAIHENLVNYVYSRSELGDDEAFVTKLREALPLIHGQMITGPIHRLRAKGLSLRIANERFGLHLDLKSIHHRTNCFIAAQLLVFLLQGRTDIPQLITMEQLLVKYPTFRATRVINNEELVKLLNFYNLMTLAILMVCPNKNRQRLFDIVTRLLEGKRVNYPIGGGQSSLTTARCIIFNDLIGIPARTTLKRSHREECVVASLATPRKHRVISCSQSSDQYISETSVCVPVQDDPDTLEMPATPEEACQAGMLSDDDSDFVLDFENGSLDFNDY